MTNPNHTQPHFEYSSETSCIKAGFQTENRELDEEYERRFQSDLGPYTDAEGSTGGSIFLAWRLRDNPRLFHTNPELESTLARALRQNDDKSLLHAGTMTIETTGRQVKPPKPISALISGANFIVAVSNMKRDAVGNDGSGDRMNYILRQYRKATIAQLNPEEYRGYAVSAAYLDQRLGDLHNIFTSPGTDPGPIDFAFLRAETSLVFKNLKNLTLAEAYQKSLPTVDSREYSDDEVETHSRTVREVFKEVVATRTHGVKLATREYERGGSLTYDEPATVEEVLDKVDNVHPLSASSLAVACVAHSAKKRPKKIKHGITTDQEHSTAGEDFNIADLQLSAYIGKDGELYLDRECAQALLPIARRNGKYERYREFQATVLADYFDMTHAIASIPPTAKHDAVPKTRGDVDPMDTLGRLMIPRITRKQPSPEEVQHDFKREVRLHDVTYHVRELQPGWHASPRAIELAKKYGVVLADNETFVKPHRRGSEKLGRVAGYELVHRPQSDETSS